MENDTWEVMSLPTNQKAIKYRWIFSIKPGYKETPLYAGKRKKCTLRIKEKITKRRMHL
jgi:hypothetical protein